MYAKNQPIGEPEIIHLVNGISYQVHYSFDIRTKEESEMDMNLLEVEYMLHARKAEVEESMCMIDLFENEKRKRFCVRVFGFEVCI